MKTTTRPRSRRPRQIDLPLPAGRGGRRRGAGRKRTADRPRVGHRTRPAARAEHPVHVTLRVRREVWNLRARRCLVPILAAIAAAQDRFGVRVCHYSVQHNHIHMIVECVDGVALGRAMKGLAVRIARALNRVMGRKGSVFEDRYHADVLASPRRARNTIAYVLGNARRHGVWRGSLPHGYVDPCSSAIAFDGWSRPVHTDANAPPVVSRAARSWLLRTGWSRAGGLVDPSRTPGPVAA